MPAKKPKDSGDTKPKDDDEDVLFEGELTWTHEPVPISPEILKRTPRGEEAATPKHQPAPSEGSVEVHELREGGGEIFNVKDEQDGPAVSDEPAATGTEVPEEPELPMDVPSAADEMAALEAEAAKPTGKQADNASGARGRTVMPLHGFNKTSLAEGDPFEADQQAGGLTPRPAPTGPVASQFAAPDDPELAQKSKRNQIIILSLISLGVLLVLGAVAAYLLLAIPNRPDTVLMKALSTTLQQPSVQLNTQVTEQNASKQNIMQASVVGGISQAGSFDLATRLSNASIPETPLTMNARSIDGRDSFIQLTGLPQNVAYLTKLGLASTSGPALQRLEGKWIRVPGESRPEIMSALGFDIKAANLGGQDKQTIADIYSKNAFLSVAATLPDVAMEGSVTRHFQLGIDKTRLTAFLMATRSRLPASGITQKHIDAANQLDTASLRVEVWIDSETSMITKLLTVKTKRAGTVSWETGLTRYGNTLELQQPTPATDIIGALQTTIGPDASDADAQALLTKLLANFSTTPR